MFFISLAIIIVVGIIFGKISLKFGLPAIIGMIAVGMIFGPYGLNLIEDKILNLSPEIKKIALVVLLLQSGVSLDYKEIAKVKKNVLAASFIPSTIEMLTIAFLTHTFLNLGIWQALMCGCIVAASSPAVIVPKMLEIKKSGLDKGNLAEILISGTSIEGIYLILLFNIILEMYNQHQINYASFATIPIAMVLGIILGIISAIILKLIYSKTHMSTVQKTLSLISMAFVCIGIESIVSPYLSVSGLIGVATLGLMINESLDEEIKVIRTDLSNLWVFVQLILFVLVGCAISPSSLITYGITPILIILAGLIIRFIAFFLTDLGHNLTKKERLFGAGAYLPKATVQAAIASTPLTMNIPGGELIQTIGLMAIIIGAMIGGVWIEKKKDLLI